MRLLVTLLTVVTLLALSHPHVEAQGRRQTLPEAARAGGGPINRSVDVQLRATTLSQLVQEADVIVRGRVGRSRSYLSPDEYDILTDHTIEPIELIRPSASTFGVRPGVSPPEIFTVTQWGGAIIIDGHRVKSEHSPLRPLQPGMEAVFLLKRDGDKFRIVRDYLGVFAVAEGAVRPASRAGGIEAKYRGMPLEQFLGEVKSSGRNGR